MLPVVDEDVFHVVVPIHSWRGKALIDEYDCVVVRITRVDFKVHPVSQLNTHRVMGMHLRISTVSVHDKIETEVSISN